MCSLHQDNRSLHVRPAAGLYIKSLHEPSVQGTTRSYFEVLPTVNGLLEVLTAPQLPCYILGLKEPLNAFMGREDTMIEMEETLAPSVQSPVLGSDRAVPRSFALCGTPGIGKSQLAAEYMHRHKDKFDAVFWVHADSNDSISDGFLSIAREMRLLNDYEDMDSVIARNLTEWLSNPLKQPRQEDLEDSTVLAPRADWLLIFDNADDLDALKDYWPETGPGAILLTSRNPLAKEYSTNRHGSDLQALQSNQAATILRLHANVEETDEMVRESTLLADRLGNLPLALSQVASVIRREDLKFSEFLEVLDEEALREEFFRDERDHNHTLSTIWRIERLSSTAKGLLNMLSLLDRGQIRDTLFEARFHSVLPNIFPVSKLEYYNAQNLLMQTALISRNKHKGEILIHPLLQTVTRTRMSSQQFQDAFSITVNILTEHWSESSHIFSHESSLWEKAEQLSPHVIKIADEFENSRDMAIPISVQRDLAELLQKAGWYLAEKGTFTAAERLWDISLRICEQNADEMPEEYADALFCSGFFMSDTNQFKQHNEIATKHFEQRMKIGSRTATLDFEAEMAHSEMAFAHLLRYEEAIIYSQKAREINIRKPNFVEQ